MKKRFNIKLVRDYIEGNDIEDYDIDELENNYQFMIDVINYTNDKNIYNLCSEEVKNNYEFIKFIINKFSNELEFIHNIANKFIKQEEDSLEKIELILIMKDITKSKNEDLYEEYCILAQVFYLKKIITIEVIKTKYKEQISSDKIGKGFLVIEEEYASSNIVMNFFAEKMINSILFNDEFNIEKKISQDFRSFGELEKIGINNYIINLVNIYDYYLANYICCHPEVLNELKKQLNNIKIKWDSFIKKINNEKYNKIFNEIQQYTEENELESYYYGTTMLYYIAYELGIIDEMKEYDYFLKEKFTEIIIEIMNLSKEKMNICELRHYNEIKKIIISCLKPNHNKKEKKQLNSKVLKLDFKNKSVNHSKK